VADFVVTRAGAILAVSDFGASLRFYRDQLGLTEVALYDDPPYVTLTAAGARSRAATKVVLLLLGLGTGLALLRAPGIARVDNCQEAAPGPRQR
jgi:catechol 2,3-dioxygenase-like lactoylglutathione lyase family enzyme